MNKIIGKKAIKVLSLADCLDVGTARNGRVRGLKIQLVEGDTSADTVKIMASVCDDDGPAESEVELDDLIAAVKKVVKKAIKAAKKSK